MNEKKNTELHSEETLDGRSANRTCQHNVEDGTQNTAQQPDTEQLNWLLNCIVKASRHIAETERFMLIDPKQESDRHFHLCIEHIAMRRTVSAILAEINKNAKGRQMLGELLFNPINGKTEPVVFCGEIGYDVPDILEIIFATDEQYERMLHDARQEAVNWLIDYETGKLPPFDEEKFNQQFFRDMELDPKSVHQVTINEDNCEERDKVADASWLCEGISKALQCITEEERNKLIDPSFTREAHQVICWEYLALRLTASAILAEINKEAKEGPAVISTQLFNPFNGKTEMTKLCKDYEKDIAPYIKYKPENAEQHKQMLHNAQREAARWLANKKRGELPNKSIDDDKRA